MTKQEFAQWASKEVILMDGATGSNLMAAGMPQNSSTEIWMLEHPEAVKDLQSAYTQAGSRIVYACTFSANRESLKKHGLEGRVEELNIKLAQLTREAVGDKAYVAGDLTMTGKLLEPLGDMTEEELLDIYKEQITALVKGGVDLLGIETMLSLDEIVVALKAAKEVCDLPVMCTLTVNANGMTLYGTDAVEAVTVLEEHGAAAVGINCSLGPDQLADVVRRMKEKATVPVIAKPNAGLPTAGADGKMAYSMDAEEFADHMKGLLEAGARIVGGCCGTTPEYIEKLNEVVKTYRCVKKPLQGGERQLNLKVIACKILQREIASLTWCCKNTLDLTMVRQRYHQTPMKLHDMLQKEIDLVESGEDSHTNDMDSFDAILLGYGLCSNALVGLHSSKYPLVLPRAHDCITLFMGGKEIYQKCFDTYRGAFFYGPVWTELGLTQGEQDLERLYHKYMEQYEDEDTVEYLMEIERDMLKHYKHAVYVTSPSYQDDIGKEEVKREAKEKDWRYIEIEGSNSLLKKMLDGDWSPEEFLIVPPGYEVAASVDDKIISAVPRKD